MRSPFVIRFTVLFPPSRPPYLWSHAVWYAPQHQGAEAFRVGQDGGDEVPGQVSYGVVVGELQVGLPAQPLLGVLSLGLWPQLWLYTIWRGREMLFNFSYRCSGLYSCIPVTLALSASPVLMISPPPPLRSVSPVLTH